MREIVIQHVSSPRRCRTVRVDSIVDVLIDRRARGEVPVFPQRMLIRQVNVAFTVKCVGARIVEQSAESTSRNAFVPVAVNSLHGKASMTHRSEKVLVRVVIAVARNAAVGRRSIELGIEESLPLAVIKAAREHHLHSMMLAAIRNPSLAGIKAGRLKRKLPSP